MRLAWLVLTVVACAEPHEDPMVVVDEAEECGPAARLAEGMCTELSAGDRCVKVEDVCIPLCDQLPSCSIASDKLRVLNPWRIAPEHFCVECAQRYFVAP